MLKRINEIHDLMVKTNELIDAIKLILIVLLINYTSKKPFITKYIEHEL